MTAAHTEQQIRRSVEVLAREWHRIQSGDESTFRAVEEESRNGQVSPGNTQLAKPTSGDTKRSAKPVGSQNESVG